MVVGLVMQSRDNSLRVSGRRDTAQMLLSTDAAYAGASRMVRELALVSPRVASVRRMGSAALDLAWVAAGRFDGFWERGAKSWDVAAGILLVRESGGLVGTIEEAEGNPLEAGSIVAANAEAFAPLRRMLAEA